MYMGIERVLYRMSCHVHRIYLIYYSHFIDPQ
jgi:hypothetical protein